MELKNDRELEISRAKLRDLEELYAARDKETGGDQRLREVSMQSVARLIKQLKEEIARYEAHQPVQQ